jgi:cysteine sulfinate desulfinase/cysteine desulfurase-like protein
MKNWSVDIVQPTSDRVGNPTGSGFVLYDETGQPCVTFGYASEKDARAGREHVEAALANVASVKGR